MISLLLLRCWSHLKHARTHAYQFHLHNCVRAIKMIEVRACTRAKTKRPNRRVVRRVYSGNAIRAMLCDMLSTAKTTTSTSMSSRDLIFCTRAFRISWLAVGGSFSLDGCQISARAYQCLRAYNMYDAYLLVGPMCKRGKHASTAVFSRRQTDATTRLYRRDCRRRCRCQDK